MIWAQGFSIVKFPLKWRLVSGVLVAAAAMLLFSFVDGKDDYWSMIFVGLIIGGGGKSQSRHPLHLCAHVTCGQVGR